MNKAATAEEILAALANNPEYSRRKALQEEQYKRHWKRLARDEAPIVADLITTGDRVATVWDLIERQDVLHGATVGVLLDHLERGHHSVTKENIARALAFAPADMVDPIVAAFGRERDPFVRPMLAQAIVEISIRSGDAKRGATLVSAVLADDSAADIRSIVDEALSRGGAVGREIAEAAALDVTRPAPLEDERMETTPGATQRPESMSSSTSIGIDVGDAGRLVASIAALPGYEGIEALDIPGLSHRLAIEDAFTLTWQLKGDVVEIELFKDDVDAIDISLTGLSEHIDPIDAVLAAFSG